MQVFMEPGRILMGRLPKGCDLLAELSGICQENRISLGEVRALGAVERARIGYYDMQSRQYRWLELEQEMEILSLVGNVSLKDGEVFVHAHITLGDEKGRAFGGHLAEGSKVFACEYAIWEYTSPTKLERVWDEPTGLYLWG